MMSNVKAVLAEAKKRLAPCSHTPSLDAELLLAHVLSVPKVSLISYPERRLTDAEQEMFNGLIEARQTKKPIAYLLGHKEFWSQTLKVSPAVLIPRPETELLVELLLREQVGTSLLIAELGTGSGAIALSLARERPRWIVHATDLSETALQVAKQNADDLTLHNVSFYQGNWCHALPLKRYDVIVSNPPYLSGDDPHLQQSEISFEPSLALVSGSDGLEAIRSIVREARGYLKPAGQLVIEHGWNQAAAVRELFEQAGFFRVELYQDLSGLDRVTRGQYSEWM